MKLDRDYFGAMAYLTIILSIMLTTVAILQGCVEGTSLDPRETVRERAQRHFEWCNAYCEGAGGVLTELRIQGNSTPICICSMPEPTCDGDSCDLEWD